MKNNKGFSFVELLVAVAILGIISLPIASSFALAAKTDAKAAHLSAMNDAADDVMLLLEEIETLGGIPEGVTDFDYYIFEVFKSLLNSDKGKTSSNVITYEICYNGYAADLIITKITKITDQYCYRIDLKFTHTVAGSSLDVHRKGLLEYDKAK